MRGVPRIGKATEAVESTGAPANNQTQHRIRTLIIAVLAVCATFAVLMSAGRPVTLPWAMDTHIKNGVSEATDVNGGVISDNSGTRLIFTNSDQQVTNIVESSFFDEVPMHYSYVACNDSAAYVVEFTYFDNTGYIKEVNIAKYALDGQRLATLQEFSYNLDDQATIKPPVFGLWLDDNQGYVLMSDVSGNNLFVQTFSLNSDTGADGQLIELGALAHGRVVSQAEYSAASNTLTVTDDAGNVYVSNNLGLSYSLVALNDDAAQGVEGAQAAEEVLGTMGTNVSGSSFLSSVTIEDKVLQSALPRTVTTILFWIAALYLAVLCIVLMVRFVLACLRNEEFGRLKKAMAFVLVVCLAGGIVVFYSFNLQTVEDQETSTTLSATASAAAAGYSDGFANAIAAYKQDGLSALDSYDGLENGLEQMALATAKAGKGVFFTLICEGEDGAAVTLLSSSKLTFAGARLIRSDGTALSFADCLQEVSDGATASSYYDTITAAAAVTDGAGNTVGLLSANSSASSFGAKSFKQIVQLFLILVNLMIALSFIVIELGSWIEQLVKRQKLKRLGAPSAEVAFTLARPMMFLVVAATNSLAALLSLIAKDMLVGTAWEGNGLAIAIPEMALTAGMMAAVPFAARLSMRMGARLLLSLSALAAVVFYCVGGIGVSMGSMAVMTAAVFASIFCTEIAFVYASKLPVHLKDGAQRAEANRSIAAAIISATTLSGLAVGPVAEMLGNQFVFYLAAAFSFALFVFVLVLVPKNSRAKDTAAEKEGKRETAADYLAFLLDPKIAALLLCVVVPMFVMSSYKSYLFPLLANQSGLDKTAISSILVYCYALCYYLTPAISRVEKNTGPGILMVACGFLLSLTFVLFFFNGSLAWAIVALVVFTLLYKIIQPAYATFWQNHAIQTGASEDAAYVGVFATERLAEFIRSPLIGALMTGCGLALVCPILGVALGILTTVFAAVVGVKPDARRRSAEQPPAAEEP